MVECPEFLLNWSCLAELAKRHGLKPVLKSRFDDFFRLHSGDSNYRQLISIMQALEPYYPSELAENKEKKKKNGEERDSEEYEFIESRLNDEDSFMKSETLRDREAFATLSKSEWEVATLCSGLLK